MINETLKAMKEDDYIRIRRTGDKIVIDVELGHGGIRCCDKDVLEVSVIDNFDFFIHLDAFVNEVANQSLFRNDPALASVVSDLRDAIKSANELRSYDRDRIYDRISDLEKKIDNIKFSFFGRRIS